ncbi:hypothetical protein CDD82_6703 [Ophiocordyceps australis]|uniref:Protein kinase domain-containing protein n=1 Tax=Ophiocordyceps australis TaxID=1399860 RepID=A0A2C5ZQD8_9HYPO|nr:hypothetical protein CDD82_6703 [Ophiocordyceps australis]
MSTIQQIKNLIRHGKQARAANFNEESQRKPSPTQAPVHDRSMPTEPPHGQLPTHKDPLNAYSEAPGDAHVRAAQAGHAAAHHVEPAQTMHSKAAPKTKRVDQAELQAIVAEENAVKSKFPRYPGLERWELLEKMGDGAFSNVYRARDLQGDIGQAAIKVVRKYEMNSMQVS